MLRRYHDTDEPQLRRIFELQGFDYQFPDLRKMLDIHVFKEDERVISAVGAMPTADIYLLIDPTWETPRLRKEMMTILHNSMESQMERRGVVQVHSWIPPQIAKSFGRRLMRDYRWTKPEWTCFARKVGI